MSEYKELVSDAAAFSRLSEECEKVLDTRKRLPEFVFRNQFDGYFAIEHGYISGNEFGEFLFELANAFGDDVVNYMTIEPSPINYYHKELAFYGLASFDKADLVKKYRIVMSRNGDADSFLARGGDVGVFWGSSLKWAIFCDRVSWGMAVIGVSDKNKASKIIDFRCMNTSFLSEYMKSQYSHKPSVAIKFIEEFLENYAI